MRSADDLLNELIDGQRLEDLRAGYCLDLPLASDRMDEDQKRAALLGWLADMDLRFRVLNARPDAVDLTYEQLATVIDGGEVETPLGFVVMED